MAEFSKNIWAPWRLEYVGSIEELNASGCFLCRYWQQPDEDEQNLVLWRGSQCLAVFNRFPYTNGHLLIAPGQHLAELEDLPDEAVRELFAMTRDAVKVLREVVKAQGFNIGLNLGRCAGAGLPGHLHVHVVPRWEGDTNFVPVLSDARIIPQSLQSLHKKATEVASNLGLPRL